MVKGFFCLLFLLMFPAFSYAANLLNMQFTQSGEVSKLELSLDSEDVVANKIVVKEDKQILVDLANVSASSKVIRSFDTSEFSGSVVFISAYKKSGSEKDLRIAIQLRDNVRANLTKVGSKIIVELESRFGAFSLEKVSKGETVAEKIAQNNEGGKVHIPKSESVEDILENLTMSGRKRYIGKKISFDVTDTSVEDLLKMLAETSGFNIILAEDIKKLPPMTLTLTNIAWDQALDTILELNELVAAKNGIILTITTLAKATEKNKALAEAAKQSLIQEPLVTKIFPISFATLGEMEGILKEYITKERGSISKDERTNSFIVKDTAPTIEKLRKIVEALDTQTPQVLIESKIVEVTESYKKEMGLQKGVSGGYDPLSPSGGANSGSFVFSSAPAIEGTTTRNLFGLAVSRWNRLVNLDFTLQLMESESKGKVVASPKVITQNKKKATITSVDTSSYEVTETVGTQTNNTYKESNARLSLDVTPQVTNDGSIVLEVNLSKEQFGDRPTGMPKGPKDKSMREVKTNVLVDNGMTIVIGGIYSYAKTESVSGVPWLKDIPIVGWLFRTPYAPETKKSEMVIFLTPRIINQEEAGIVSKNEQ